MAHMPDKPVAPVPAESVTLFGVRDGARRLGFLAFYFGACMLTVRSSQGASLGQLVYLHALWSVVACFFARDLNGYFCELADEAAQAEFRLAQEAYARELLEAMQKQPLVRIERNPETGELEDIRVPLRERPMIDKEMGVRVRD